MQISKGVLGRFRPVWQLRLGHAQQSLSAVEGISASRFQQSVSGSDSRFGIARNARFDIGLMDERTWPHAEDRSETERLRQASLVAGLFDRTGRRWSGTRKSRR